MKWVRCDKCKRLSYGDDKCGCQRYEWWSESYDGTTKDSSKSFFTTTISFWQVAQEIAEDMCYESPEMYKTFMDDGVKITVSNGEETRTYTVTAEQEVRFDASLEDEPEDENKVKIYE